MNTDNLNYNELLDRTSIVANLFEWCIFGHPVVEAHPEIGERVKGVMDSINLLHSDIDMIAKCG